MFKYQVKYQVRLSAIFKFGCSQTNKYSKVFNQLLVFYNLNNLIGQTNPISLPVSRYAKYEIK